MLYLLPLIRAVVVKFFTKKKTMSKSGDTMQSGELIVTGKDRVDIKLHHQPNHITARFGDNCEPIPCDPRDFDFLEYELHHIDGRFVLRITWDVAQMRTIFWEVSR